MSKPAATKFKPTTAENQRRWIEAARTAELDYARWWKSVPEILDPTTGAAAAQRALEWARVQITDVALSHGGTVPPPPWPASPEVQKQIAKLKTFERGFTVIGKRTANARWPKTGKMGLALQRHGRALFSETAKVLDRFGKAPTVPNLSLPEWGSLAFAAGLLWLIAGAVGGEVIREGVRSVNPRRRRIA